MNQIEILMRDFRLMHSGCELRNFGDEFSAAFSVPR